MNYQIQSVLGTWLELEQDPLAHYCRSQLGEGQAVSEATHVDSVVFSHFEESGRPSLVGNGNSYAHTSSCGGIEGSEGAPLSHAHTEH